MWISKSLNFYSHSLCQSKFIFTFCGIFSLGNWLKRSSLSGLTDGVEDLLDISSVDRLSFNRQGSKVCVFEFVFVRSLTVYIKMPLNLKKCVKVKRPPFYPCFTRMFYICFIHFLMLYS